MRFLPGIACLLLSSAISPAWATEAAVQESSETAVAFEKDIRPLLKAACFHCHGELGPGEGGLDVRLARLLATGGDSGPAFVPGKREESVLYQRVRDGEMPPDQAHRLTNAQVELIGKWIDSGAKTLRPEPEKVEAALITEEERAHWAFQKVERPAIPVVKHADQIRTPIDAFLLAKLEEQDFTFSEPASVPKLVRRARLDLIGLPPTPEEIQALESESRPDAWEHYIDDLLASPQYGERWGRHWLDVAGYADSDGVSIQDAQRPHAWRYRDYVIGAFNEDKPFDQFILEQLAGDELITSPMNNLSPEDAELLVATGFLRMAPDGTSGTVDDANIARNEVMAETIKIVTSSLMGLTVGCAQCHDHRYDPISAADYYRLRAVFEPAINWKQWRSPKQRLISLYTDADRKQAAEIEQEAKVVDAARLVKQQEFIDATFELQRAKLPEDIREAAATLKGVAAKDRTPEQKELIKKYPSLNVSAGSLYLYNSKAANELKAMAADAKKIRDTKPAEHFVHALTEVKGQIPASFVFYRGDIDQPKEEVTPAGLAVLSANSDLPEIPSSQPGMNSSGRRLALARQLIHPNHPLTARVLVNRIWMHHFGRGLVTTPADFGALGAPPTHPELLDWLASEFIQSGWSVKHMHRLMMNSTAYRQSLRNSIEQDQADPNNTLYGGATLNRLDAEAIRDSILAVSGCLNASYNGPPVPVMADTSGRWVLGIENLEAGRPGAVLAMNGKENVRSAYVEVRRSRPYAVLDTFDWPTMTPNCELRRTSTNTPQSLMLMNSDFMLEYAGKFARRIESLAGEQRQQQVELAWKLAYGRPADQSEVATGVAFLEEQSKVFADKASQNEAPAKPDPKAKKSAPLTPAQSSLNCLCQILLSSNEFLYVD